MLTSFKRDEWKEPADMEALVDAVTSGKTALTPEALRQLFPFRGVALRRLIPYGVPEGTVLPYLRVKHELSLYPIVGVLELGASTDGRAHPRRLILSSDEVQLLEA